MMKANPVQIVIVGCGAVSQEMHAPALQSLERAGAVTVVGLVDPGEKQRAALQKVFPGASTYSDLASCPLNPETLVIVASPPRLHAEQSIFALERGAAVLCEKPMAGNSVEAELMLESARASGAVLTVGLFRRFYPAAEMLRDIFEKQPFGALQEFSIQEGGKFGWGATSDSYFKREMTMGGVLYDSGVHVVDLLLWWLGEPSEFTYQDDAMGGIEANCEIEISYPGDVRGTIRLSRDWETQNRYLFSFERGTVVFDKAQANRLNVSVDGVPFVLSGEVMMGALGAVNRAAAINPTRTLRQSFTEQIRDVVAAMRSGRTPRVPGEEGIRSLRFIEDCYSRRTLMDMPWLTGEERSAAEALAEGKL